MKHETIHELLALRLYGELSTEEQHSLEEHLATCAECTSFAAALESTLGPLVARGSAGAEELPADWSERLRQATNEATGPRRPRSLATFVAGLAAGLLLMAALRPTPGPVPAESPVTIVTNGEELAAFTARTTPPPRTTSRGDLAQLYTLLWR